MSNKFIPRLFIEDAEIISGEEISMDKDIAHYLRTVMRLDLHKPVFLFNNISGEFEAKISELGKAGAKFLVGDCIRLPKRTTDLTLLCAPIAKERFRFMIEKATELGVSHFRPVMTDHTSAPKVIPSKCLANAKQAVEQCERLDIPTFDQPERIIRVIRNWDARTPILYCAESGLGANLKDVLPELEGKSIAVLVGPEGGFSADEDEILKGADFVIPVSLGPRILRAETAVISALSVVQAMVGDWDSRLNDEIIEGDDFADDTFGGGLLDEEEEDDYGTVTV